jgi:hypothetical protein
MKTGLERLPGQLKTRPANRYRRKPAVNAMVDHRGDNATQCRLIRGIDNSSTMQRQREKIDACFGHPVQKVGEEEELLQGKFVTLQRQGVEEEELLQGKFDTMQRQPEEEELMQGKFAAPLQRETEAATAPNKTGLPDNLKSGIESLSGMDISDVRVHYNSPKPSQLNAHAYAQGSDIHLGSGQEKHLPHETWHTIQQRQGRVQPTMELGGEKINDDAGLEREADVMGEKALQYKK